MFGGAKPEPTWVPIIPGSYPPSLEPAGEYDILAPVDAVVAVVAPAVEVAREAMRAVAGRITGLWQSAQAAVVDWRQSEYSWTCRDLDTDNTLGDGSKCASCGVEKALAEDDSLPGSVQLADLANADFQHYEERGGGGGNQEDSLGDYDLAVGAVRLLVSVAVRQLHEG
jgi:hypothetical protein